MQNSTSVQSLKQISHIQQSQDQQITDVETWRIYPA